MGKKRGSVTKILSQAEQQELFESIMTRSGAKLPEVRACIGLFHKQKDDSMLEECLKDANLEFVLKHLLAEAKKFTNGFAESTAKVRDVCADMFKKRKLAAEANLQEQEGATMVNKGTPDPDGVHATLITAKEDDGAILNIMAPSKTEGEGVWEGVTLMNPRPAEKKSSPPVMRAPKKSDTASPATPSAVVTTGDKTDGDAPTSLATPDDLKRASDEAKKEPAADSPRRALPPPLRPKTMSTEASAEPKSAEDGLAEIAKVNLAKLEEEEAKRKKESEDSTPPRTGRTPTEARAAALAGAGITPDSINEKRKKLEAEKEKKKAEEEEELMKDHGHLPIAASPALVPAPTEPPAAPAAVSTPTDPEPATTAPKPEPPKAPKRPWWKKQAPAPKADATPKAKSGGDKTTPPTDGKFKPLPPPGGGKKEGKSGTAVIALGAIALAVVALLFGVLIGRNATKSELESAMVALPVELAKGTTPTTELLKTVVNGSGTADCFHPKASWEDLFPKSPPAGPYVSCNLAHAPLTGCNSLGDMDCECHVIRECVVIAAN
jgi:hypothetical protein